MPAALSSPPPVPLNPISSLTTPMAPPPDQPPRLLPAFGYFQTKHLFRDILRLKGRPPPPTLFLRMLYRLAEEQAFPTLALARPPPPTALCHPPTICSYQVIWKLMDLLPLMDTPSFAVMYPSLETLMSSVAPRLPPPTVPVSLPTAIP